MQLNCNKSNKFQGCVSPALGNTELFPFGTGCLSQEVKKPKDPEPQWEPFLQQRALHAVCCCSSSKPGVLGLQARERLHGEISAFPDWEIRQQHLTEPLLCWCASNIPALGAGSLQKSGSQKHTVFTLLPHNSCEPVGQILSNLTGR